jgi:Ca-activated chloride channel family protein
MQRPRRCLKVATTALGIWLLATPAPAADSASLMIVVDGSGSMAGLLEPKARQTKIDLVRSSLKAALVAAGPQSKIGLATFGNRRGGCNDFEVLRPAAAPDVGAISALLARIRPRGRGPIAFALREAAKQLANAPAPRSLLLIHDGADNCQQDVCAAAADLAAAGITANVVSLGLNADDLAKMACVPQATGGHLFKVDTAEQAEAAIAEAVRAASGEIATVGLAPPGPPAPWATTVVPPVPIPATGPAALHLRALAAPNTDPVSLPLHWTVARKDEPTAVLLDAWTANPVVPITPGDYVVTVANDLVSATRSIRVHESRPTAVPVVLGAGTVQVHVTAQKTNAPLADAIVTISTAEGVPLSVVKASEVVTLLPPGRYRVSAELGLVRGEQTVSIVEGRPAFIDLTLNVGRVQLTTAARDGISPLDAPLFIIMEDDPPRGRREVARSAATQAEFALPPGTYYVVARQGGVEARERLEIAPGDVVRRTLGALVGKLALSTSSAGPAAGNLVSYSLTRLDDPDQETIETSQAAPTLVLPVGRYRVEGRYGSTNVASTQEVEIKAGQTVQLPFEHQAATLRLRLAGIGAALADVSWQVRDEAGRTVWATSQTEDAAVIEAGRYIVTADTGERREERILELKPGETRTVEIRLEPSR